MVLKCIWFIMKENLLLLKDLLEHWRLKSINRWLPCQRNVYIDKLNDIVGEYNNIYHRKIKMKLVEVKDNPHIDFKEEVNDKNPKFKGGDHVRNCKYKNIFAKGYTSNWLEKVFAVSKIKNTVLWTYVINVLNGEEIIGTFYEKKLQKNN